ncbi:MAG: amidohydrolase family protein [Parasphingorhabdus sp.]
MTFVMGNLALSQAFAQNTIAYKGATLVDPGHDAPLENSVIIVRDGLIDVVGTADSTPIPPDADTIDVSGHWITPGLIDAHIHFSQSGGLYTRPDGMDLRKVRPYESDRAHSKAQLPLTLRRYLASGITSVVDAGGPKSNFAIREIAGDVSPRIAFASPLLATLTPDFAERVARLDLGGDPTIIPVGGPDEARKLVQEQLKLKPDLIKIWYIDSPVRSAMDSYDTVAAIIDEAHKNGLRVAAHATELETARLAVQAGTDILVHTVDDKPIDDAFVAALKTRDVIVISTVVVYEHVGQLRSREVVLSPIEKELGDPVVISSWKETPPEMKNVAIADILNKRVKLVLANLKTLADADVRVAAGTDAGNPGTLHGPSLHRELALLEGAGFSAKQILRAATIDAADVFSANPDIGTIAPGKRADFLVLRANPAQSVAAYQEIDRVVFGGVSHDPAALAPFSPAALVQRQLEAYNAHDTAAFAASYAEDVELFELPASEPQTVGRDALTSRYDRLFKKFKPNCRVLSRIVEGDYVIDQEFCDFGTHGRLRATAIYQVEDDLIRRVWLATRR